MRSIFGWDLPPGCSYSDPNAPWNQGDGPCDICGLSADECICPECPECGAQGDIFCYHYHGLVISDGQKESKAKTEQEWAEQDKKLIEYEKEMEKNAKERVDY